MSQFEENDILTTRKMNAQKDEELKWDSEPEEIQERQAVLEEYGSDAEVLTPVGVSVYRKKPVTVEAAHFNGSLESAATILKWVESIDADSAVELHVYGGQVTRITVHALEWTMTASPDEYIIRGIQGEFYPCKPDIFWDSYEPVTDPGEGATPSP